VFDGLENKDLFCSTMKKYAPKTIPLSILLPYDCHLVPSYDFSFPSIPAVLKTAMGSCGDGVWFVFDKEEVMEKVKSNYERAHAEPNFMESIMFQCQRIPAWVLCEEIKSFRIMGNRKFHLRTYVLVLEPIDNAQNPLVFIYNRHHEVRVAAQAMSDIDCGKRERKEHITNGAQGSETIRLLLDNVPEICHLRPRLENFVAETFGNLLIKEFKERINLDRIVRVPSREKFAICGLDVMVDREQNFQILEVNRNPAAPPSNVIEDPGFKEHLVSFARDLHAVLRDPKESDGRHGFVRTCNLSREDK
jgi:hypothetical protein